MKKESPGEPGLVPRGVVKYIGGSEQCTGSEYTLNSVDLKCMVVGKTAAPYHYWVTVGRDLTQAQSESLKRGLHWSAKPVKVADDLSGVADHTQSHDRRLAPKSKPFLWHRGAPPHLWGLSSYAILSDFTKEQQRVNKYIRRTK